VGWAKSGFFENRFEFLTSIDADGLVPVNGLASGAGPIDIFVDSPRGAIDPAGFRDGDIVVEGTYGSRFQARLKIGTVDMVKHELAVRFEDAGDFVQDPYVFFFAVEIAEAGEEIDYDLEVVR